MAVRPGHHRPLGTTTRMRFPDWLDDGNDIRLVRRGPRR